MIGVGCSAARAKGELEARKRNGNQLKRQSRRNHHAFPADEAEVHRTFGGCLPIAAARLLRHFKTCGATCSHKRNEQAAEEKRRSGSMTTMLQTSLAGRPLKRRKQHVRNCRV